MKDFFITIFQVSLIYSFNLIGEWIQKTFHLIFPGSIIGLVLLFSLLSLRIIPEKWVAKGASFFLTYMAFFFVPATIGVMNHFQLFTGYGLYFVAGIIISSCLVMISSGIVSGKFADLVIKKDKEGLRKEKTAS